MNCKEARAFLGEPYSIVRLDGEDVVYRKLNDDYDFEISIGSVPRLYVWQLRPHKEIVGVYVGTKALTELKDMVGYYAFKYQNLAARIRIEREDTAE